MVARSPHFTLLARIHRCAGRAGELLGEFARVGKRSSDPKHRQTVRVAHDRHATVLRSAVRTPHLQDKKMKLSLTAYRTATLCDTSTCVYDFSVLKCTSRTAEVEDKANEPD